MFFSVCRLGRLYFGFVNFSSWINLEFAMGKKIKQL